MPYTEPVSIRKNTVIRPLPWPAIADTAVRNADAIGMDSIVKAMMINSVSEYSATYFSSVEAGIVCLFVTMSVWRAMNCTADIVTSILSADSTLSLTSHEFVIKASSKIAMMRHIASVRVLILLVPSISFI